MLRFRAERRSEMERRVDWTPVGTRVQTWAAVELASALEWVAAAFLAEVVVALDKAGMHQPEF